MSIHFAAPGRSKALLCAALLFVVPGAVYAQARLPAAPSRAPIRGCRWEAVSSKAVALSAWVQRCDFGTRTVDLFFTGHALVQRYSDGGAPDTLIEVIDMRAGETPRATVTRAYTAHASAADRKRCVIAPYTDGGTATAGTERFAFVPNPAYASQLAKRKSDDVPEPPCGDWGVAPDGIQYFQTFPSVAVRRILFVRVGQDDPLFDEKTLTFVQPVGR